MNSQHLDGVLAIERLSFPTPWSRASFLNELYTNECAFYYVCLWENKVIGYAGMWIILDEAHLTNIAVHPSFRRRGIGELLLDTLIKEALNLGAERMTLEVRISNIPAQRLYEKKGFVRSGIRKGYYTDTQEDAIIMWKTLREKGGRNG